MLQTVERRGEDRDACTRLSRQIGHLVVRRGFSDAIEGGSSAFDLGDDAVDGLGPHERLRVVVPV